MASAAKTICNLREANPVPLSIAESPAAASGAVREGCASATNDPGCVSTAATPSTWTEASQSLLFGVHSVASAAKTICNLREASPVPLSIAESPAAASGAVPFGVRDNDSGSHAQGTNKSLMHSPPPPPHPERHSPPQTSPLRLRARLHRPGRRLRRGSRAGLAKSDGSARRAGGVHRRLQWCLPRRRPSRLQ